MKVEFIKTSHLFAFLARITFIT